MATRAKTLRHIYGELYVAEKRLVRTTKSFKTLNAYQRPATHILNDWVPYIETLCGYRDVIVVGGSANETHICSRCRYNLRRQDERAKGRV